MGHFRQTVEAGRTQPRSLETLSADHMWIAVTRFSSWDSIFEAAGRKGKCFGGDCSVRGQDGQERREDQRPKRSQKTLRVPLQTLQTIARMDAQRQTKDHL